MICASLTAPVQPRCVTPETVDAVSQATPNMANIFVFVAKKIALIPADADDDKTYIVQNLESGHNRIKKYRGRRVAVDEDGLGDGAMRGCR